MPVPLTRMSVAVLLAAHGAPSLAFEPFVEGGNLKLDWNDCGDSSYHAKVKSLVPNVLSIGKKTTITGSGDVDEQVSAGAFTITAKFGVTEHYSGDVCAPKVFHLPLGVGSITWDGLKCPVAKGTVSVGVDVSLSSLIPAKLAKGTIEIKASGASKENLICVDIKTSAENIQESNPIVPIAPPSLVLETFVKGGNLKLDWNDCGDSSYHAKVKSLVPNVLPIGKKTTITGSGDVDEQVTAGAFTITAKFGVTEHYSGDVCAPKVFHLPLGVGSITWDGLKCPVAKGTVSVGVDVSLSSLIPAKLAKGTIEIKASGASKENLICVDIKTSAEQVIVV